MYSSNPFPFNDDSSFFNFSDYPDNPPQITYHNDDVYPTLVAKFADSPLSSRSIAQLMVVYKPSKITLERRDPVVAWDEDLEENSMVSLGDGETGFGSSPYTDSNDQPLGGNQLLEEEFEYMTDGDFKSTHELASNDLGLGTRSDAMIATGRKILVTSFINIFLENKFLSAVMKVLANLLIIPRIPPPLLASSASFSTTFSGPPVCASKSASL